MTLAYEEIPVPGSLLKHRTHRVTVLIDWGIPIAPQQDLLRLGSAYVDLAKIAVGLSRLMERAYLAEKISLYRAHEVESFPGGMFLEYAYYHGMGDAYLRATRDLGYRFIEVSDNIIHFPENAKYALIQRAINEYGLTVLGEVGSKHETTEAARLVSDIRLCLDAGSWKVFVEATEFFADGKFRADLANAIALECPLHNVILELPGKWIRDIHLHQVHWMMIQLIDSLGSDVNIANVLPEDVLMLESLRQGIGANMKLPSDSARV